MRGLQWNSNNHNWRELEGWKILYYNYRKPTEPGTLSPIKYLPIGADDRSQKISDILVNICNYMNTHKNVPIQRWVIQMKTYNKPHFGQCPIGFLISCQFQPLNKNTKCLKRQGFRENNYAKTFSIKFPKRPNVSIKQATTKIFKLEINIKKNEWKENSYETTRVTKVLCCEEGEPQNNNHTTERYQCVRLVDFPLFKEKETRDPYYPFGVSCLPVSLNLNILKNHLQSQSPEPRDWT